MRMSRVAAKYATAPARIPYFTQLARRSSHGGGSSRMRAGTTRSRSCVSEPYAQMRPQYRRPHKIVEATVNTAKRYQARLNLKIGRFRLTRPKMLTIEIN